MTRTKDLYAMQTTQIRDLSVLNHIDREMGDLICLICGTVAKIAAFTRSEEHELSHRR